MGELQIGGYIHNRVTSPLTQEGVRGTVSSGRKESFTKGSGLGVVART